MAPGSSGQSWGELQETHHCNFLIFMFMHCLRDVLWKVELMICMKYFLQMSATAHHMELFAAIRATVGTDS